MTFEFDPQDARHARALARLESEQLAWLGTIGRDGFPHSVPIWFLWRGGRAIMLSEPHTAKARNLRENARAQFHLEAGDDGEQWTILRGTAAISPESSRDWLDRIEPDYSEKYHEWMQRLGLTTSLMATRYTAVIEFTPLKAILQ